MKTNQLLQWAVLLGIGYFAYTLVKDKLPCADCNKKSEKPQDHYPSAGGGAVQHSPVDLVKPNPDAKKVVDFTPDRDVAVMEVQDAVIS